VRDISAELSEEQQLFSESIVPEIKEIAKKATVVTGRYHDNLRVVAPSESKAITA
jgi:hypothetical protein